MSTAIGRGCGWFLRPPASPKQTSWLSYRVLFDPRHATASGTDVYLTSTNGTDWGLEGFLRLRGGYPAEFNGWDRDFVSDGVKIGRGMAPLADLSDYLRETQVNGIQLACLRVFNQTTRIGDQWTNDVFVWATSQWGLFHRTHAPNQKSETGAKNWGPVVEFISRTASGIGFVGFDQINWSVDGKPIEFSGANVEWSWHDVGLSLVSKTADGSFLVKG